jgi:hypothetical protein
MQDVGLQFSTPVERISIASMRECAIIFVHEFESLTIVLANVMFFHCEHHAFQIKLLL